MKYRIYHLTFSLAVVGVLSTIAAPASYAQTYTFKKNLPTLKVNPSQIAKIEVSTENVNFNNVLVGTTRVGSIYIFNTGLAPLTGLSDLQITGAGFGLTSNCDPIIASGGSCLASVTFTPTAATSYTGELSFKTSLSDLPVKVPLAGTGLSLTGNLVPNTSTDFGSVVVGSSSQLDFMFSNTGSINYTNLRPILQGTDLAITASTCGTPNSPITLGHTNGQNTCTVSVTYSPTTGAALSNASLAIASNQFNSNSLSLTGFGAAPSAAFQAVTNNAFGAVNLNTTASRTFTFTNNGNVTLSGVQASVIGSPALSLGANTCGTSASPVTIASTAGANTCSVIVNYTPTEGTTLTSATVQVSANELAAPRSITLTGSGNAPLVQWEDVSAGSTTSTWAAGSYAMGSGGVLKDFKIRNKGVTNLIFTSAPFTVTPAGSVYVYSTTCQSATLAPNATCNVQMQFAPITTGAISRTVSVNSNQSGASTLVVSGTGTTEVSETLLLIDGEGANNGSVFNNRGMSGITLSRTGTSVFTSTATKKYGSTSIRFSNRNAGEYLATNTDTRLRFGYADFTVEWWQYRTWAGNLNYDQFTTPIQTNDWIVGHIRPGYTDPGISFCYHSPGINCWTYGAILASGTPNAIQNLNVWHHVAVTRQGPTYRMYVNGSKVAEWSDSKVYYLGSNATSAYYFGTYTFEGYLDDIRVIRGKALYTGASFTPPGAL